CHCLLPQSFTMHHIHEILHRVVFTYSSSNYMDSFVGQVQVSSLLCFLCLPRDLRSGAHNEIEFPQFKFSFAKFVSNSDMQFQRL
ncbi:hypothetical protein HN873_028722, partial [Arachis hypogaea]